MSTNAPKSLADLSIEEVKEMIRQTVRETVLEVLSEVESSNPSFSPEIDARLKKYRTALPKTISVDEVVQELGLDA